jgi:hypothetical protein
MLTDPVQSVTVYGTIKGEVWPEPSPMRVGELGQVLNDRV